ncbi:MAG TPA: hypothetical protein VGP43_09045 [Chitinophagaceae bacterium]|nr:hypothetical protein [Chitinophagaceae bacterium]
MKKVILYFYCSLFTSLSFSQVNLKKYIDLIDKADSFYEIKDYKRAANTYSLAFNILGKKTRVYDIDNAVYSWMLCHIPDSAFYQLEQISNLEGLKYNQVDEIISNEILTPLHEDKRWKGVLNKLYVRAYKNFLSDQREDNKIITNLNQKQIYFALALSNHSDSAFSHLNDRAYTFIKKKMYDKAYKLFKLSLDHFSPNLVLYRNMMDYYVVTNDKDRAYVYFSRAQVLKYKKQTFISDTLLKIDSAIKADYRGLSKLLHKNVPPPEYLNNMVANAYLNAGMTEKAYTLFKMNVDWYSTSYTANKDMGAFFYKTGNKEKADLYNTRSLILQYNLPDDFFKPSFNIEQYIIARNDSLAGKPGMKPMPPEPFIDNVANQFLIQQKFDIAGMLFKMNVDNYPTSYYAHKSMSSFYVTTNNKLKKEQFELQAQAAKEKYGARRSRVLKDGPIADTTFDVSVINPVCQSNCPTILVDYVHHIRTVVSLENDIKAMINLLTNDGFKVVKNLGSFTKQSLAQTNFLIIRGGQFEKDEIQLLNNWVLQGGALLTFTHHDWPLFDEVLQTFGIQTKEIETTHDSLHGLLRDRFTINPSYIYFSEADSLLGNHPILKGRNISERIKKVQTLASKTIIGPRGSSILLKLSKSAVDFMSIDPEDRTSRVGIKTDGFRSLGIAFNYGKGKVVVTDAWALMALLFEPSERGKMGMNTPGNDNKQFALNIMRWLTGYLK